jgi:hypothetical protein
MHFFDLYKYISFFWGWMYIVRLENMRKIRGRCSWSILTKLHEAVIAAYGMFYIVQLITAHKLKLR